MSNDNYDADTKAQLSRAQALEVLFQSSGWKFAEEDLLECVQELRNIETIDLKGDVAQQVRDRQNLAEGLLEWLYTLKSQVNNAIIIKEKEDDKLITRR